MRGRPVQVAAPVGLETIVFGGGGDCAAEEGGGEEGVEVAVGAEEGVEVVEGGGVSCDDEEELVREGEEREERSLR